MAANDGGPAFPQIMNTGLVRMSDDGGLEVDKESVGGMSLRDWFAGQALAGLLACPTMRTMDSKDYAAASFQCADAMLSARQETRDAE